MGFIRELNGRVAKVEISVYDAMIAEIINERNAEKEKHRRQRSDARKHKETKQTRRETKQMRNFRLYGKSPYPENIRYIDVVYCGGGIKQTATQPTILMRKIAEIEKYSIEEI